ncbi:MAG: hypothetical protein M3R27_15545 [Bacteroidota bacterium]|nr:hypothetical protein [Bacteroidota bacterium]
MKLKTTFSLAVLMTFSSVIFTSCKKDKDEEPEPETPATPAAACSPATSFNPDTASGPRLIFKFKFDSTQVRLNNLGNPSTIPAGNAAQSPIFNFMSQHYIELAGDLDPVGGGKVLYVGQQTTAGGSTAIDFCASVASAENAIFFSKAISQITPGSYKWLRISLAYQNYDITYKSNSLPGSGIGTGTLASFIGFRSYITGYQLNGHSYTPSSGTGGAGNHTQGYWGFETNVFGTDYFIDGQSAGATTVPNPLFATSPIPAGSCLVTGQFVNSTMVNSPLVITGAETSDIIITVSLSTNKSFEWDEVNADGYYQPDIGEFVVDMGIRGLIPIKN